LQIALLLGSIRLRQQNVRRPLDLKGVQKISAGYQHNQCADSPQEELEVYLPVHGRNEDKTSEVRIEKGASNHLVKTRLHILHLPRFATA
jgi:hypothetical protein